MAVITVAHHPELTPESALEVFRRHLDDRYDVHAATGLFEKWLSRRPHFLVRKTGWATVAVWLRQGKDTTSFEFSGMQPPATLVGAGFTFVGLWITHLIARLLLRSRWKAIEADIALVIESASEFNPPGEEHFRRGLELGDRGEWQEAIAEFDRAISLNPNHVNAHAQRGFAYAELEEAERAIADMEKAIALTRDRDTIANLEANIRELREQR